MVDTLQDPIVHMAVRNKGILYALMLGDSHMLPSTVVIG